MDIAILGATGQIGRSLAKTLAEDGAVHLFARDPKKLAAIVREDGIAAAGLGRIEDLSSRRFDVVINAAGPGDPMEHGRQGSRILDITETLDHLILAYQNQRPDTAYIFFSTGGVYGPSYERAADDETALCLPVSRLTARHMYPLAKLAAEARHRLRPDARIADIRLFGYVSRHLPPDGGFLLSEVLRCQVRGIPFRTDGRDFVRDYVGPEEAATLVRRIIAAGTPNEAFDLYSAEPLTKWELIDALRREFELEVETAGHHISELSSEKPSRVTVRTNAERIGYAPTRTSIQVVVQELQRAGMRRTTSTTG